MASLSNVEPSSPRRTRRRLPPIPESPSSQSVGCVSQVCAFRAVCPVCGRSMPLTRAGTLRIHGPLDNRCKGSGMSMRSTPEDSGDSEDSEDGEDTSSPHNASAPVRANSGLASYPHHYAHRARFTHRTISPPSQSIGGMSQASATCALCPVCNRSMPLTRSGTLRTHGPLSNRCTGSGMLMHPTVHDDGGLPPISSAPLPEDHPDCTTSSVDHSSPSELLFSSEVRRSVRVLK